MRTVMEETVMEGPSDAGSIPASSIYEVRRDPMKSGGCLISYAIIKTGCTPGLSYVILLHYHKSHMKNVAI